MSVEDFGNLSLDNKILEALFCDAVATRETPPQWTFIVYKAKDFYIELKFDEFDKDHLVIDARAISPKLYDHYLQNDFYYVMKGISESL